MFVDLHMHTLYSDGKLPVKDTIDIAIQKNISLLSITDHDTVKGVKEAIEYSHQKGVTCISGVELSCRNDTQYLDFPQDISIHLLGYNIDYSSLELQTYLTKYHQQRRLILNELVLELAQNDLHINYEDIHVIAGKQMRIQDVKNHISSCFLSNTKKKFYISIANKYYTKLFFEDAPLQTAIDLIKKSGGLVVLAHAFFSYRDYDVELNSEKYVLNLLDYLCALGVDGIETYYPKFTIQQSQFLQNQAQKRNLIITAGSDFHGTSLRKDMMDFKIKQMSRTYKFFTEENRYK